MNKDEILDEYVKRVSAKIDIMPAKFVKTNQSDKRHMENGFRYAISESIEVLKTLLSEEPKKENAFRNFIDKQLGLKAPTQEDIDKEKSKIEMEKVKLDLARIRAESNELKKSIGGDSPFASFIKAGNAYNPIMKKKKDTDDNNK